MALGPLKYEVNKAGPFRCGIATWLDAVASASPQKTKMTIEWQKNNQ